MTDLDTQTPEFKIAESGYDPAQVDAYVADLQRLIADAEERARNAEAEYVFDQHAAIGPRIAEIFALAEAETRAVRERFSAEGDALISEARSKARTIIDAAEQAARELREGMEQDRRAMLDELEQDRERIHGEVNVLERRKGEALAELGRLSELLGEATTAADPPTETLPAAPPPAPAPAPANAVRPAPANTVAPAPAHRAGSSDETAELPAVTASAKQRRRTPRTPPKTAD